jgi:hypothetical protein
MSSRTGGEKSEVEAHLLTAGDQMDELLQADPDQ